MSDENPKVEEPSPEPPPAEAEAEVVQEAETPKSEEAGAEASGPQAKWRYKQNFGINEQMKKVINLTIDASNAEIAVLRRKLERLTYGS